MKHFLLLILIACNISALAQLSPTITSWDLNTDNHTGYGGILADVQQIQFSTGNVYVKATNIPSYTIGPWPGNPNVPTNQNWTFKITRTPLVQTGTKTATPLGQIGVWRNGLTIFNAKDAMSYNNQNIWHQNAVVVEASSFDACKGHPAPSGVYHNHQNPSCLYSINPSEHSGILGYAFDGFPVYGPYGYSDTAGTGPIVRIQTSYRTRSITLRTTLPDGTVLPPSQYGPAVGGPFPLGYYIEDFEYVSGLGHLDAYNGRFCVTPEYPSGTYAYFVTVDSGGGSAYPYILGPSYYGILIAGNTGPGGGHVTITESTTVYTPANISSTPSSLSFGSVGVGTSKVDTIRLYNTHVGTLVVSNVTTSNPAFVPGRTSFSIAGGTSDTVSVTFVPSSGGTAQDTLRITSNAPTGVLNVPLSGTGATGVTQQYPVQGGWNLISVPLTVVDALRSSLFPSSISPAYGFSSSTGYVSRDTLSNGEGYWLKFGAAQNVSLTGDVRTVDTIEVYEGWNIIGPISFPIDTAAVVQSPSGILQSAYFGYDGGYVAADTLEPAKAYWVKAGGAGQLTLQSSLSPQRRQLRKHEESITRIRR